MRVPVSHLYVRVCVRVHECVGCVYWWLCEGAVNAIFSLASMLFCCPLLLYNFRIRRVNATVGPSSAYWFMHEDCATPRTPRTPRMLRTLHLSDAVT